MVAVFLPLSSTSAKLKRSPLEIGLVSFNNVAKIHNNGNTIHDRAKPKKSTVDVPLHPNVAVHAHVAHVWIPGRVHDHSYIPAHVHHVLLPTHALLLSENVHAILVPPVSSNVYRNHIGGFGVGLGFGGQGAGHGFHISS